MSWKLTDPPLVIPVPVMVAVSFGMKPWSVLRIDCLFCELVNTQVTLEPAPIVMMAFLFVVDVVADPAGVHVMSARVKPVVLFGLSGSVTVNVPAGTPVQVSVLPVLFWAGSVLPCVFPVLPLSFKSKAAGVVSDVQLRSGPAMSDVKLKALLSPRGLVCLMILIDPQFERLKLTGPTRSSIDACSELPELRLMTSALPNVVHSPGPKTSGRASLRLIDASPNSLVPRV